jgi:hypothetical protein
MAFKVHFSRQEQPQEFGDDDGFECQVDENDYETDED